MRIGSIEVKRRVWISLGGAVFAIAAWWGWTQSHRPAAGATSAPALQPFVRFAGASNTAADRILRERADLLDPTPLFFPTEWNYGQQPLPDSLRPQSGQVFASFQPKWTFDEQSLKMTPAEADPTPEGPADVLAQGNGSPFAGFGHVDVPFQPLPERTGFLEVRDFGGNKLIIEQALVGMAVPRPDYSPIEFVVAIGAGGVIGEPVVAAGSGWEEVDAFFRSYLVKTFRLGVRLNPGQYRVVIGP